MQVIHFYTSSTADLGAQGFALALGMNMGCDVLLLPLSLLPAPDPTHRPRLLLERAEVGEELQQVEFCLEQYRSGAWQPDAGHQNGLEFDRQALKNRLTGIDRTLHAEKGGEPHADEQPL
jgi:hypothetical protein